MTPIRIVLVDDHPVVLAGVAALLRSEVEIDIVATTTSAAEALEAVTRLKPDIALIDISLPDMSGLSLAARIAEVDPQVRVIALTVHESRAYVQPLLQAGVRGYVLKRAAADDLVRAVRAVARGGLYLDPSVAEQALASLGGEGQEQGDVAELSAREEAVLRMTAQGFSNKEIAARLEVSVKSVETYKARATGKLKLHSRAQIVRFGASRGWLDTLES